MQTTDGEWVEIREVIPSIRTDRMQVGRIIQGEVLRYDTDEKTLTLMEPEGTELCVYMTGMLVDLLEQNKFEHGCTYRITRMENFSTPGGASRTRFKVEVWKPKLKGVKKK